MESTKPKPSVLKFTRMAEILPDNKSKAQILENRKEEDKIIAEE
jgi:hypothetical protein